MIYRLLPGIQWRRERPNRLLVFLPDSVLKIEGVELTNAAEALVSCSPAVTSRQEIQDSAQASGGVKPAICEFAFDLLVKSRVLVKSEKSEPLTDLEAYFYLREGTLEGVDLLKRAKVVCYCFTDDQSALAHAFQSAGLAAELRPLQQRMTIPKDEIDSFDVVACIGLPFHHPFARALNRFAVEQATPVLFSEYCGGTARVGPTVIGRNLTCLDCVSTRHAANGGGAALDPVDDLTQTVEAWPARPLSHPILRELLLQHSVLEVSRIVPRKAPASFGGYLELNSSGETLRREVLKVPRCVTCSPNVAVRYPFDVTAVS